MQHKESYRQIGRSPAAAAPKQKIPRSQKTPTSCSIPSKFETLLNIGNRELNAFGARTHRFQDSDNELPGPGSYRVKSNLLKDQKTCGSISKLGYGSGFVSKSGRFASSDAVDTHSSPGPGQYHHSNSFVEMQDKHGQTSAFAKSVGKSKQNELASGLPGPGQYDIHALCQTKNVWNQHPSSSFSSRTTREFQPLNSANPAPGQYENPLSIRAKKSRASLYIFKSNIQRINLNPSTNSNNHEEQIPGPGYYNSQEAENKLHYDTISHARCSSMFGPTSVDRFGNPFRVLKRQDLPPQRRKKQEQAQVPGPGTYSTYCPDHNGYAAQSVFKSKSIRINDPKKQVKAPGPAFYTPHTVDKRSFLLNASKKWV